MDTSNSTQNSDSFLASWLQQLTSSQIKFLEALRKVPVLGLKLTITPDFVEKIQQQLQKSNIREQSNSNCGYYSAKTKPKDVFIQQTTNKTKAENFPISLLKIGSWERGTRNEGDLVAKCYFAKRKLVWEFLEKGLKRKIEIQWNDISSLRVSKLQNQSSSILEIELNTPPSFHHEIDPQPRKHTQWRIVSDFTGGQALTFRRHWLKFSPGVLEKPLEKLLKHDNRLYQLIHQSFPTQKSPYFDFSFDFGGKGYVNHEHQQQFSFSTQNYSNNHSPAPVMPLSWDQRMNTVENGFSHIDYDQDGVSDDQICSNPMPLWSQGMNNVGGVSFATTTASDFQMINSMNQLVGLDGTLQNMSLNNSKIDIFSNGIVMNNLNNMITTANYEPQNLIDDNNVGVMSNSLSRIDGSLQANRLSQSQVPYENTSMNMVSGNYNVFYSSANSDRTLQYFSNFRSQ